MELFNTKTTDTKDLLSSLKSDLAQKNQLIRIDEVSRITTLAKSTINLWVAQSKFPKPTILSPTVKVWLLVDINKWVEDKTTHQAS